MSGIFSIYRNALLVAAENGFGTVNLDEIDFQSDIEPPLAAFDSAEPDSQETVTSWRITTCEQGLFYREHQKKIIDNFTDRGFLVIKLMKTNTNGIPDLMVLKDGVCKFIEVKKPNGKISELQKYRIKQLRKQKFDAVVMDGIDSLIY